MATVRHLQECGAARTSGWSELLTQPTVTTIPLSQTVLTNQVDADTAPLRSGDMDVAEMRQGTTHRRRANQVVGSNIPRTSSHTEDDIEFITRAGPQQEARPERSLTGAVSGNDETRIAARGTTKITGDSRMARRKDASPQSLDGPQATAPIIDICGLSAEDHL